LTVFAAALGLVDAVVDALRFAGVREDVDGAFRLAGGFFVAGVDGEPAAWPLEAALLFRAPDPPEAASFEVDDRLLLAGVGFAGATARATKS
jgi:hypothetical protein